MDIRDYDQRLRAQNWNWRTTESGDAHHQGREEERKLLELRETSPAHKQLFAAYLAAYGVSKATAKATGAYEKLDLVRVEVGVLAEWELQQQKERRQETKEVSTRWLLEEYDSICSSHDWFYWNHDVESVAYRTNFEVRQSLTNLIRDPQIALREQYRRLFRAWAAYKNFTRTQTTVPVARNSVVLALLTDALHTLNAVRDEILRGKL